MEDKIMKKKENTEQKMRSIRRTISFPPFYFYAGIVISLLFYFVLPDFNLIIIPFNLIGIIFLIFGAFLIIKNTIIFKSKNITLQLKESSCIVQDGCYKYSRNPMYLGKLIFLFGLSIVLGNIVSFINPILFFGVMNYIYAFHMKKKFSLKFLIKNI